MCQEKTIFKVEYSLIWRSDAQICAKTENPKLPTTGYCIDCLHAFFFFNFYGNLQTQKKEYNEHLCSHHPALTIRNPWPILLIHTPTPSYSCPPTIQLF